METNGANDRASEAATPSREAPTAAPGVVDSTAPAAVPAAPFRAAPCEVVDSDACSRLVAAALELFNRKGYAATTVREIVEAAGVTKPVLYYHFGSKEGIYVAILQSALDEFTSRLALMEGREGTARERIETLLEDVFDLFREHAPIVRLVHAVFYGPSEAAPPFDFENFQKVFHLAIQRLVEEGINNGEFRSLPVDDVTLALQGLAAMCMDLELVDTPLRPGREGVRRILDVVFTGIQSNSVSERE